MLSPFSTRSRTSDAFFRNSVKVTVFIYWSSKRSWLNCTPLHMKMHSSTSAQAVELLFILTQVRPRTGPYNRESRLAGGGGWPHRNARAGEMGKSAGWRRPELLTSETPRHGAALSRNPDSRFRIPEAMVRASPPTENLWVAEGNSPTVVQRGPQPQPNASCRAGACRGQGRRKRRPYIARKIFAAGEEDGL